MIAFLTISHLLLKYKQLIFMPLLASGIIESTCVRYKIILFIYLLTDVFLEVNNVDMKPLDEYMLFTKTASNKVFVKNPQGIRSARCASFDAMNKPRPGPSLNTSFVCYCCYSHYWTDVIIIFQLCSKFSILILFLFQQGQEQQTWVIDPPARVAYISQYSDPSLQEDRTGKGIKSP